MSALLLVTRLSAQDADSTAIEPPDQPIDVDFLFHYYEQDGEHSAVTGGVGTEKLEDIDGKIIVTIPLDQESQLSASAGLNHYTSASTDNINSNVSSASRDDYRTQLRVGYDRSLPDINSSYGFHAGGSVETDYISIFLGGNWTLESDDDNRELAIAGQVYFDRWMLIFPDELREAQQDLVETDKRRSYYFSLTYSQVVSRRIQASLTAELVYQYGLLSTPFHRVFFNDAPAPRVEKLPDNRFRYPLGLRLHYFLSDVLILRLFFRSYFDSFGIQANTFSFELPLKITNAVTLYPHYRYHTQTGADYFREFNEHTSNERYYTSDFDLSGFHSQRYGMGVRYSPLYGIVRLPVFQDANLKSLELRYSNYRREDGLTAFYISVALAFIFW